jgi:hypothetical protein
MGSGEQALRKVVSRQILNQKRVPSDLIRSLAPTGMHGIEHRVSERWTFRPLCSPPSAFFPLAGSTLPGPPQPFPSLPYGTRRSGRPFARLQQLLLSQPHSRVNVPGLILRSRARSLPGPFGLPLYNRSRFRPASGCFPASARCLSASSLRRLFPQPPLPFGAFTSLRIKAFD